MAFLQEVCYSQFLAIRHPAVRHGYRAIFTATETGGRCNDHDRKHGKAFGNGHPGARVTWPAAIVLRPAQPGLDPAGGPRAAGHHGPDPVGRVVYLVTTHAAPSGPNLHRPAAPPSAAISTRSPGAVPVILGGDLNSLPGQPGPGRASTARSRAGRARLVPGDGRHHAPAVLPLRPADLPAGAAEDRLRVRQPAASSGRAAAATFVSRYSDHRILIGEFYPALRPGYPDGVLVIGTSGWQYRDWRPGLYPAKLPQRLWLEHFAEALRRRSRSTTPSTGCPSGAPSSSGGPAPRTDFRFAVKMSRYLTHIKRLQGPGRAGGPVPEPRRRRSATSSGRCCCSCRRRCGPTSRRWTRRWASSRRHVQVAVEPRHDSWWTDEVRDAAEAARRRAVLGRPEGPAAAPRCGAPPTSATCGCTRAGRNPGPGTGAAALSGWLDRLARRDRTALGVLQQRPGRRRGDRRRGDGRGWPVAAASR